MVLRTNRAFIEIKGDGRALYSDVSSIMAHPVLSSTRLPADDERARLSVVNQRNLGLQIRQNSAKNNYVHIIVSGYKFTTLSVSFYRF